MSLIVDLPPELETELAAEAARLGLSLSEHVVHLLGNARTQGASPRSGAELVAYWRDEGVVGMRPDIADAVEHARALRKRAEQRHRA